MAISSQLCSPFHRRADFQQPYRINDVRLRTREENSILPERCGIRMNKFAGIQSYASNAPTLFRYLKCAESSPWQSLVPRGAVSASYQVALPVLPRQFSGVTQWTPWRPTMGGSAGLGSDFFDRFYFPENLP